MMVLPAPMISARQQTAACTVRKTAETPTRAQETNATRQPDARILSIALSTGHAAMMATLAQKTSVL